MDMNKILQNIDSAEKGTYEAGKEDRSEMKTILESFYDVAAEDSAPQQLDEIASVTMSGDSADEVAQLVKLMNDAGAPEAAPVGAQPVSMPEPVSVDGPPDMPAKADMITPKMMDDFETAEEEVIQDEYANEPDEKYDDHEKMTHDLSGGLNRQKGAYADAEDGDNAMAVESKLKEELSKMLKQKMSEKKDQDGDGDNDFDDVKIARMKASGMSHEEAVAKVKGNSDTNEDMDVAEDDDPCWKNYKQVGMKKGKGGKKVPNCVPKEGVEETAKKKDKEVEEEKKKGVDGKACWDGYRYAGKKQKADGTYKDKCVKVNNSKYKEAAPTNNPVAKNAGVNKAQTFTDRKKEEKKKGKVKHKGKDMPMESVPVFDRYVKPFLNKTPAKMIEFYDREALAIIDRLSKERRSLSESGKSIRLHDVIIGKLRENLSALPENVLTEMRSRRGSYGRRSSFDIGRTGYGDGRGGNLGSDKASFKRAEMDAELGDEVNNYAVSIGGKTWKVFTSERAAQKAANTIKSKYGKDTKVYQTGAPATS